MEDSFRFSAAHVIDLQALLGTLSQRYPGVPLVVVGHSNGTMSAATLSASAADTVKGTVLIAGRLVSSSYSDRFTGRDGLSRFDWEIVKQPVLLVHHKKDGCPLTPYRGSEELATKMKRFVLTTIDPPGSGPVSQCDLAGTHNFVGDEAAVADAIVAWGEQQFKK
jgi:pimeloyl-ACP methyl ester carboxylesterase